MGSVVLREAEHLMKEFGAKDFLRSIGCIAFGRVSPFIQWEMEFCLCG
jgi:hypothetical protein